MNPVSRFVEKWRYRWQRRKEREYTVDGVSIILPPGHLLDWYQRLHPRYDQFLPVLAGCLPADAVVLDIGANIGDSAVPFLRRGLKTWCVEPAPAFLTYLHRNLQRHGYGDRAVVIDRLISTATEAMHLQVERGTAFVSHSDTASPTGQPLPLGDLIQEMGQVDLIKSDTDGFDHDVLLSGLEAIKEQSPILYFENTITPENQSGYESVYAGLEAAGYHEVHIFNNRGQLLHSPGDWETLRRCNAQIRDGQLPDTPYLDILTSTARHKEILKQALDQFSDRYR